MTEQQPATTPGNFSPRKRGRPKGSLSASRMHPERATGLEPDELKLGPPIDCAAVAATCGVSEATIRRMVASGHLPHVRIGAQVRIERLVALALRNGHPRENLHAVSAMIKNRLQMPGHIADIVEHGSGKTLTPDG